MPLDALDQIPGRDAGLRRRRTRKHADHGDVAEPLGQHHPNAALGGVLFLQVLLELIRIQVTGERIDGFQKPVHGSERHALQVGFFDILALDARHDFREHRLLAIRAVAGGGAPSKVRARQQQNQEAGRRR